MQVFEHLSLFGIGSDSIKRGFKLSVSEATTWCATAVPAVSMMPLVVGALVLKAKVKQSISDNEMDDGVHSGANADAASTDNDSDSD